MDGRTGTKREGKELNISQSDKRQDVGEGHGFYVLKEHGALNGRNIERHEP